MKMDEVISENLDIDVEVSQGNRRLPVYLLLDTSGSMAGSPIESVRRGLEQFKRDLEDDTYAKETVHIGVITFGGEAEFVTKGLIPFDDFEIPALPADGRTPLGQAFYLLMESLDKDVKSAVQGGEKSDWKPLIFILTDGEPNDEWIEPRQQILNRQQKKIINMITVGCGPDVNEQNLKAIAIGPTFWIDKDEESFLKFFEWVTQSVVAASKAVSESGGGDKPIDMPDKPDGWQYIP